MSKSNLKQWIYVKFTKRGIHRYPEAAIDKKLHDVNYLGNEHHHFFEFLVKLEVFTDNRDIEFHQFLNWVENLYQQNILTLDYKSCEMIGFDLAKKIIDAYPNRSVGIDVSEDGYVGAIVEIASPKKRNSKRKSSKTLKPGRGNYE